MKKVWYFRILTLLYLGAVALLCFANFSNVSEMPRTIFGLQADKVVHFLMFLPFPLLSFYSFESGRRSFMKTFLLLVALFVLGCLLAWGTELIQSKLPYRSMDPEDFKADRLGLLCGTLAAFVVQLFSFKKQDA